MSVSVDGCSLLTCLKRLLLWKTDVLQTSVCQILQQILDKPNRQSYCQAVLESDLLGVCSKVFLFYSPSKIDVFIIVLSILTYSPTGKEIELGNVMQ